MPPLRVMTYNVRYFGHATRGLLSTNAAVSRIAAALAAIEAAPDLVCLQEVETTSLRSATIAKRARAEHTQLDQLMIALDAALEAAEREHRYTAYYFPAHVYRLTGSTNIYTTGLAVLAKDGLSVDHHNAGKPHDITHRRAVKNLKQTRICAHVSFKHQSGAVVDVFNTHLSLPGLFYKEFWTSEARMGFGPNQVEEARVLADFVEQEKRGEHAIIVGDFNSLPGSAVDRYLRDERGLVDAFSAVTGAGARDARAWPTAGFLNLRMHIDHVYSTASVKWLDFEGSHPFGERGPFHGLSDHVPLIARCRLT